MAYGQGVEVPGLRLHILEWNDDQFAVAGKHELAANIVRRIRVGGEDQHHDPAFRDGLGDGGRPVFSRGDVPGCDPAADARRFDICTDTICDGLVFT